MMLVYGVNSYKTWTRVRNPAKIRNPATTAWAKPVQAISKPASYVIDFSQRLPRHPGFERLFFKREINCCPTTKHQSVMQQANQNERHPQSCG